MKKFLLPAILAIYILGGSVSSMAQNTFQSRLAVVMRSDTIIRNMPQGKAVTYWKSKRGTVLQVVGQRGKYYAVLMENNRYGWILKRHVELLPFEIHRQIVPVRS